MQRILGLQRGTRYHECLQMSQKLTRRHARRCPQEKDGMRKGTCELSQGSLRRTKYASQSKEISIEEKNYHATTCHTFD